MEMRTSTFTGIHWLVWPCPLPGKKAISDGLKGAMLSDRLGNEMVDSGAREYFTFLPSIPWIRDFLVHQAGLLTCPHTSLTLSLPLGSHSLSWVHCAQTLELTFSCIRRPCLHNCMKSWMDGLVYRTCECLYKNKSTDKVFLFSSLSMQNYMDACITTQCVGKSPFI